MSLNVWNMIQKPVNVLGSDWKAIKWRCALTSLSSAESFLGIAFTSARFWLSCTRSEFAGVFALFTFRRRRALRLSPEITFDLYFINNSGEKFVDLKKRNDFSGTYSSRSSRFCTENALSSSIFVFLLKTLLISSKLATFSSPFAKCDGLRLTPGMSSFTPMPRATFSFGSLSWNLPTDAVDALATVEANCSWGNGNGKWKLSSVAAICWRRRLG